MKISTARLGVLVTAALLTGPVQAQDRSPEQVWRATCAYCHGHYVAPGVAVAPVLHGRQLAPALVSAYVRNGPSSMLAFPRTEISDAELAELGRWIETSPAPKPRSTVEVRP